jgi:broad specificity phosphatase PhoE
LAGRLLLVRHGQTEWNAEGRLQGQQGSKLTVLGRAQAEEAAEELAVKHPGVEAIYASDLARTVETAQIIARRLRVPLVLDPRLRELRLGDWEGRLSSEIEAEYKHFLQHPFRNTPLGGEPLFQLARRTKAVLNDVVAQHLGGQVVVVSHEVPISVATCIARGHAVHRWWEHAPGNGEIVALRWHGDLTVILTPQVARRRRLRQMRRGLVMYPYRKAHRTLRVMWVVARYNSRRSRRLTLWALDRLKRVWTR